MAITSAGTRESDKRKLPIEEMYALGGRLAEFVQDESKHDKAIDLCRSFYRTLGVYANSEEMIVEFLPVPESESDGEPRIDVTFTFPAIGWGIVKYLYLYRNVNECDEIRGAMMLQDLYFALQGAIQDASVRIFMPLVEVADRKKIDSALYYALVQDV